MKARWLWFWFLIVAGLALLGLGLLVPAHLRAVDDSVVLSAGRRGGDALLARGQALVQSHRLGAAEQFVTAAHQLGLPGWDRLGEAVTNTWRAAPTALFWGADTRVESLFPNANGTRGRAEAEKSGGSASFSAFIVQRRNREAALDHLSHSTAPAVQELLRTRSLSHTVLLPPSSSPASQAFDTVLAECGLLLDDNRLTAEMGRHVQEIAAEANHGNGSRALEQALMDIGSLGEHLNWDQLTAFVADIPDEATLHLLATQMSDADGQSPVLFAAVQLSGEPASVAQYLARYSKTGLNDLGASLWYGADGVKELADNGDRLYRSPALHWLGARQPFGAIYFFCAARSLENPALMMAIKWLCYLAAGFCFAASLHAARPPVSRLEQPLQVRGFHLLREFLFSLGFLLVVLLLSEPFLAQEGQKDGLSFRLHLPMTGGAVPAGIAGVKQTVMNPTILITLLVFFVLQALIYVSCLVKLGEIRRQQVPPRMKLKLLENEDHLFDAGLYLGFVGTIVSLIIASMGWVKFSLMAAYSSTSFGIIFVVIFKIFQLRPARRKLLLEAELADATGTPPGGGPPYAPATATATVPRPAPAPEAHPSAPALAS